MSSTTFPIIFFTLITLSAVATDQDGKASSAHDVRCGGAMESLASSAANVQGFFSPFNFGNTERLVSYVVAEIGGQQKVAITNYGPHTHAVALRNLVLMAALDPNASTSGKSNLSADSVAVAVDSKTGEVRIDYESSTPGGKTKHFKATVGNDGLLKLGEISLKVVALGEARIQPKAEKSLITELNETSGLANLMQQKTNFKNNVTQAKAALLKAGLAAADAKTSRYDPQSPSGNHLDLSLDSLMNQGNARHEFNNWINSVGAIIELTEVDIPNTAEWGDGVKGVIKSLRRKPDGENFERHQSISTSLAAFSKLGQIEIDTAEVNRLMAKTLSSSDNPNQVTPSDLKTLQNLLYQAAEQVKSNSRLVQIENVP